MADMRHETKVGNAAWIQPVIAGAGSVQKFVGQRNSEADIRPS